MVVTIKTSARRRGSADFDVGPLSKPLLNTVRRRRDDEGKEGHVCEDGNFTERRADEESARKKDEREDSSVCLPFIGCFIIVVNSADGLDAALLFEIRQRSKKINLDGLAACGIVRLHETNDLAALNIRAWTYDRGSVE